MSDSGGRIDDENVHLCSQTTESLHETQVLGLTHVGHVCRARGGWNHVKALRRADQYLIQGTFAADDMCQRVTRRQPQKDISVGEPKVSIQEHDALSTGGQRCGEVDRDARLADAALAA